MEKSVGNLFDYINWRGDLSFTQSEFNAVDGLILCIFSYFQFEKHEDFKGKTLAYAINALKEIPFDEKIKIFCIVQETIDKFLQKTVKVNRFKNIVILDYDYEYNEETTEQFAAVTLKLDDGSIFIAFRGTDDSLVGWQEDCNLAFINGVPAQLSAAKYARKICEKYKCPIRIGGQSKGGNLAIWASADLPSEAKESVLRVLSYDGPGFLDEFLESEGYKQIKDKILSFVPDSSIVGILMGHCDYLVVKSSAHTVFQHDPLTWNVIGNRFEYAPERSQTGKALDAKINNFIRTMDKKHMSDIVNNIFETMSENDVKNLDEIMDKKLNMVKALSEIVKEKVFPKKD